MDKNTELKIINQVADQLSLNRVKTEGILFDRDYRRDPESNQLVLVAEKAVIVTQGKTTKVSIGEAAKYPDYSAAEEAIKLHWSTYFKHRREMVKSPAAHAGERRRQKRYREKRKQDQAQFKRQQ